MKIDIPTAYQGAIKELAMMDVAAGVITKEQYEQWMGEPYPDSEINA